MTQAQHNLAGVGVNAFCSLHSALYGLDWPRACKISSDYA